MLIYDHSQNLHPWPVWGVSIAKRISCRWLNLTSQLIGIGPFSSRTFSWFWYMDLLLGVLLVFWFRMSKVEISRLIRILCLSMDDCLLKVLGSLSTVDSSMVYLERMGMEMCVLVDMPLLGFLPPIKQNFWRQRRRFHRRFSKSKSRPSRSVADDVNEQALRRTWRNKSKPHSKRKQAVSFRVLGFIQVMMKKPTKDMSGGWRVRVALVCALSLNR